MLRTSRHRRTRNPSSRRGIQRIEHGEQVALIDWAERVRTRYLIAPGPELLALEPDRDFSVLDLLFAVPNAGGYSGGYRENVIRVLNLRREGVKSGVPDLMLAVPCGGWPGLFIEMKRPKGAHTTTQQRRVHVMLRQVGYRVEVCRGFDEARAVIEEYLEGIPGRKPHAVRKSARSTRPNAQEHT